jgi:glycosyltransferase involved in cell wall biosynthesis
MPYRLLMLSSIPVHWDGHQHRTMDLWAVDLARQVRETSACVLLCTVIDEPLAQWTSTALVPDGISVVDARSLDAKARRKLVEAADVVQVHGGASWTESRLARRLLVTARQRGTKSIVGISSNRARTALLNVRRPSNLRDFAKTVKSMARFASISFTYRSLTSNADGTFIVGEGLRSLVSASCRALHVGTASWIQHADIVAARDALQHADTSGLRRLCIAARLERMKGVHLGIEAAGLLRHANQAFSVDIFGAGPEQASLEEQAAAAGLSEHVRFRGTLPYPRPFLAELGTFGVVLLTNLNDEQPRLVFDAISQGTLPICPDTPAYRALGLPRRLCYESGSAASLAEVLENLWARPIEETLRDWETLFAIAEQCTLDSMHASRAKWIRTSVLGRAAIRR